MTRTEAIKIARAAKLAKQPPLLERFWSKVSIKGDDECWPWTAAPRRKDEGYGAFWLNRRHQPSNRVAWMLTHGKIEEGLVVCHKCDNPPCCNPSHLFLGTPLDNDRDRKPENTRLNNKHLKDFLANKFNVKSGTISDVWNRGWKHLNEGTLK